MSESEPLERAQQAIDEARSAAADALPNQELSAPPSADTPAEVEDSEQTDGDDPTDRAEDHPAGSGEEAGA